MHFHRPFLLLLPGLAVSSTLAAVHPAVPVGLSPQGKPANRACTQPVITPDGRFLAFESAASNLVPGDRNQGSDVFVYDSRRRKLVRASVASDGSELTGSSRHPALSADGRFVAFESNATNLEPADQGTDPDIYVHDLQTGATRLVSAGIEGAASNGQCLNPSISADGRYIAYEGFASNLVPDDTNGASDSFVFDQVTGTTVRASVTYTGAQANFGGSLPSISGNGRFVSFSTQAYGMVPGYPYPGLNHYVRDLVNQTTEQVSLRAGATETTGGGERSLAPLSYDGRFVTFNTPAQLVPEDVDQSMDIYVRDRELAVTERASLSYRGQAAEFLVSQPSISDNGRYVGFRSSSPALVDAPENYDWHLYVRDRERATTERVSLLPGTGPNEAFTSWGLLSGDGLSVTFVQHPLGGTGHRFLDDQVYLRRREAEVSVPPVRLKAHGKLAFPATRVEQTRTRQIMLKNLGRGTVRGTVRPLASPFEVSGGVGGFTLAPGAVHPVLVTFAPTQSGRAKAELVVEIESAHGSDLTLPVRATGR
jgi:Tol biopolymer transport system component